MFVNCIICDTFVHKVRGRKKVITSEEDARLYSDSSKKTVSVGDVLCGKCRLIIYNSKSNVASTSAASTLVECEGEQESGEHLAVGETSSNASFQQECEMNLPCSSESDHDDDDDDGDDVFSHVAQNDEFIYVHIPRVVSTHKYCCICRSTTNLMRVPFEARYEAYTNIGIFIPEDNRCCCTHIIGKNFYNDELVHLRVVSNTSKMNSKEVAHFLKSLSERAGMSLFDKIENDMSENQIRILTGLCWQNIIELRQLLTSMRNTSIRTVTQALVVFLFKLKTGNSNSVIAGVLGLPYEQHVSTFFKEVLRSFKTDILLHFGLTSVSREDLIKNTSLTARMLLNLRDDQLVLIFDGTYIRHQKSFNNEYQRKSYSGQKKTHLCKPFTICTTNGFIVDFAGPFYGTENDATIMKKVLQDALKTLLRRNDVFVVDRGFRDAVGDITKEGYTVLMPAIKGKRAQLPTDEANMSRQVTKIRWVVEAVHGAIAQKYNLLHNNLDNKMLPKVSLLCKVVGFLHNKFGKRLDSDTGLNETIVQYFKERLALPNSLSEEVEKQHWNLRKTAFQQLVSSEILDFPRLNEEQLRILFTGSYQLSLAVSYLAEIMDDKSNLYIYYVKQTPTIIKLNVRSRHVNSKYYRLFIDYVPNMNSVEGIRGYCCDCPNGNRTVGCCAHVASVIYYLAHARYLSRILRPAEILSKIFSNDAVNVVINENSDDDD